MRLNYGKTFLLGFGFFGVSVIWGVYNAFVPIFLSEKFHIAPGIIGFFMTLDNIAALFIQPPVGAWSDRIRTPLGTAHSVHFDRCPHLGTRIWVDPPCGGASTLRGVHQHPVIECGVVAHTGRGTDAGYHSLTIPLTGQRHHQFHGRYWNDRGSANRRHVVQDESQLSVLAGVGIGGPCCIDRVLLH